MGSSNQKQRNELNSSDKVQFMIELRLVRQFSPGYLLMDPDSKIVYFLRQFTTSDKKEHQQMHNILQSYSQTLRNYHNITKIMRLKKQQCQSMCNSIYKNSILFEFSSSNLHQSILQRQTFKTYFQLSQLWNIITAVINSLDLFNQNVLFNNSTLKHHYQMPMITTQHILTMHDQTIRIMDPLILTNQQKYVRFKTLYYSPQKIDDFTFHEDQKSSIFQLAMCVIHAALLQNCSDIYDGYTINEDKITEKIQRIRKHYQDEHFCQILYKMSEVKRQKRPTITQLIQLINPCLIPLKQVSPISMMKKSIQNYYNENELENNESLAIIHPDKNIISLSINRSKVPSDLCQSYHYNRRIMNFNNSFKTLRSKESLKSMNSTVNESGKQKINQLRIISTDEENIYTNPKILQMLIKEMKENIAPNAPTLQLNIHLPKNFTKKSQTIGSIFQIPEEENINTDRNQNVQNQNIRNQNIRNQNIRNQNIFEKLQISSISQQNKKCFRSFLSNQIKQSQKIIMNKNQQKKHKLFNKSSVQKNGIVSLVQ